MQTSSPLEEYGLIGDTQTAALINRNGSIDWWCVPRFDSGACFAALLGEPKHGRWLIAPKGQLIRPPQRRYREGTLILETEFLTREGRVRLIDYMPIRGRTPDIVRIVEGVEGTVPMQMELIIRFDYGSVVPWVTKRNGSLHVIAGPDALILRSPIHTHGKDLTTFADFTVSPGQQVPFVVTWYPSYEADPDPVPPMKALQETEQWWRTWSDRCNYRGPWRDVVRSSLAVLKALTYAPSGGIVAAATASLPEQLGGIRNWDYRFSWLRDATFTLYSLMLSGYHKEAAAWRDWLVRAVAGDPAKIQIMYSVTGERRLPEMNLPWLPGYAGSRPVRVGNKAVDQIQLDVYGEVMDALYQSRKYGLPEEKPAVDLQQGILDFLESNWHRTDSGIWEMRGPEQHFTYSKVMAWVAFDRAVRLAERFGLEGPVDRWRKLRDAIQAEVCERAFDRRQNAFTQAYDSTVLDGSVLLLPIVGFLPANDPRILGTVRAIERNLMADGFVRRYQSGPEGCVDGLTPGEGAFLACTSWLADNYWLQGRTEEAEKLFQRLLSVRNDLGLLSEEYDPRAKRLVGNFPQAFSHVGIVNNAFNLTKEHESPASHRRGNGAHA